MKKYRILIVEDSVYNHRLFRDAFEHAGFEVTILPTADGYFADTVSELHPDIISMDLMIGDNGRTPEREGFEAITVLKGDLRTHEIPIIVLSNFSEEHKVLRAKELGAVDYINLASHAIQKIPEVYMRYLRNPKKFKPTHPLFWEV